MEYEFYETTKYLKKKRFQILICGLIAIAVIGVIYAVSADDSGSIIENSDKSGNLRGTKDSSSSSSADTPVKSKGEDSSSDTTEIENHSEETPTSSEDVPKTPSKPTETITVNNFEIVETHIRPGTKQYYTQGLILKDQDTFIESTGLYGESVIHYVDRKTMQVGLETKLGEAYFGEGCELINLNGESLIYQLTWKERKVFVWRAETLELKQVLELPKEIKEGWGITSHQETDPDGISRLYFYISDGSSKIFVLDAETFKIVKSFPVQKFDGTVMRRLNELEFIKGKLWANIYLTNDIVIIDLETGNVEKILNFNELQRKAVEKVTELQLKWRSDFVLNGVAYDSQNDRVIITGKMWPIFWEINASDL